jgi:hypothetical protein
VLKSYVIEVRVVAEDGTTFTPSRVTVESTGEPVVVVTPAAVVVQGESAGASPSPDAQALTPKAESEGPAITPVFDAVDDASGEPRP